MPGTTQVSATKPVGGIKRSAEHLSKDVEPSAKKPTYEKCPLKLAIVLHGAFPSIEKYNYLVTIKVGKEDFRIHQGLLCHHSTFFYKAFNSEFKEAVTNELSLPETSPKVFAAIRTWLYTRRLLKIDFNPENNCKLTREESSNGFELLVGVWIFADLHGMPEIQDAAIDDLIRLWSANAAFPSLETIKALYDNTCAASPLRRLLVEFLVYGLSQATSLKLLNNVLLQKYNNEEPFHYNSPFTKDCYVAMGEKEDQTASRGANVWLWMKCRFHVHGY